MKIEDTLSNGLIEFEKLYKNVHEKASTKVGLQLLNNCNNGSPNESTVPPILTGALRGSASVFVNDKLISVAPNIGGDPTPAKSISGNKGNDDETFITIVYNTVYASKLHELDFNPGPGSEQAGNVGNKWIEKHIKADFVELMKLWRRSMKSDLKI